MTLMTLSIPAKPEWILVLRMAVSGVAALFDLPIDVADDLKTAMDESGELLLHQDYCVEALKLTCEKDEGGLSMCLSATPCGETHAQDKPDAEIARMIIETLVREVDFDRKGDNVLGVRMRLPRKA